MIATCQEKGKKRRYPNKETLRILYCEKGLSAAAIAAEYSVTRATIYARLKTHNIQRRSITAAMKLFFARDPKAQAGPKNNHWKGGRAKGPRGYVYVHAPYHPKANSAGYVLEHRLVAEKKAGKELPGEAVVHHLNQIKNDNRPENLEICPDNSGHAKLHVELSRRNKIKP